MFSGKFSAKARARTYRQEFGEKWGRLIREHFDSPEHAAMVFGVDGSTAIKWWAGSHAPSGFAVGLAFMHCPDAARQALGGQK